MPTRTIYLVRHGQEDKGSHSDRFEGSLTSKGIVQAQLTAGHLANVPFTCAHVSTLRRADETGEHILRKHPTVPVNKTKLLWECMPSIPPGYGDRLGNYDAKQLFHIQSRIARAYDTYFRTTMEKDECDLLVCHGNLIRYFICRVLDANEHSWINLDIHNCSVSVVDIKPDGRHVLVRYNDISHLSNSLVTLI